MSEVPPPPLLPKKRKLVEVEEDGDEQEIPSVDTFLNDLRFSKPLDNLLLREREACGKCGKMRSNYCYTCMIPLRQEDVPRITLPLKVVIIHHPTEKISKSTSTHCKVIAPDNCEIFEYPEIPTYVNRENSVLLFPGKNSLTMEEVFGKCRTDKLISVDSDKLENVIFIDSTWQKSGNIFRDERLKDIPNIVIKSRKTRFWRYQEFGEEHLATIEAIAYFFQDYESVVKEGKCYDDLLFLFAHQYRKIQKHYVKSKRNFPRIQGYVKYPQAEKKRKIDHEK